MVWESLLGAFWQTPSGLSCAFFFTEEWLPSGHFTYKGLIGGVLQRWLSFWKVLPSPQRNSGALSEWSSGSWSPSWLRPFSPNCSVWQGSRKSRGGYKLLPLKNDGGHCVLGDLQWFRNVLVPFPRDTDNPFDCMAWFLLWHALSTVGSYIDSCVPFQIMSNQLNLPQGDSNQFVETSQGWSMETGCNWA